MLKLFLKNFRIWQAFILFMITIPFFHLEPIYADQGIAKKNENDRMIVFLITTPNMDHGGPERGDYDRLKRILSVEFRGNVRGFSHSKKSFIFYTNTEDSKIAEQIKAKIITRINDAKFEVMTMDELKKIRL